MAWKQLALWLLTLGLATLFTTTRMTSNKKQPNIIFILTDDQDVHMNSLDYMPSLQKHIISQGTSYTHHYCTVSLCCPSRVSLFTGKAAHNTNVTDLYPPYGGYPKFVWGGWNAAYLPIWMQTLGYGTYYIGKFLNYHNIGNYDRPFAAGWTGSEFLLDPSTYEYYNATFQRNHDPPVNYRGEYSTDLLTYKTLGFLDDAVEGKKPFFIVAAPIAPHTEVIIKGKWIKNDTEYVSTGATILPPVPAKRHAHMFPDAIVPRAPNFNPPEPNGVEWIAGLIRQNQSNIDYNDEFHRNRLRSLMAVDELIEALISRLDNYGILDDTYIFYSTDNGYHIGQHRLQPSKQCAYQEDVNIPLIVRGPGVAANRKTDIVTTHTDLAPTFLNLAGVPLPGVPPLQDFDGSVIPVQASELDHIEQSGAFGEHINVEQWGNIVPEGEYERRYYWNHTYKALRVMGDGGSYHFLYTVWCSGAHELYDLSTDPYEMNNLYPLYAAGANTTIAEKQNTYAPASPNPVQIAISSTTTPGSNANESNLITTTPTLEKLIPRLDALMMVLKTCRTDSCRHPWRVLHPQGNVHNLSQAMDPRYDRFYHEQERVQYKKCIMGYLMENELPIDVKPYAADWHA